MGNKALLFTGHIIDPIGRESERFPFGLLHAAQRRIRQELDQLLEEPPVVAISSLAAGGDMLFAEEVLKRKIPLIIFLPFEQERFLSASVKYIKGIPGEDPAAWERDFLQVLSQASAIHELKCAAELSICYASCNEAMLTFAIAQANQKTDDVLALALMNDSTGVEAGGTADFVNLMGSRGIQIKKIWPQ